jgi:hypothetical protein
MATFTTDINSIPVSRRKNLEVNAQGSGMTAAEYLASRGGLNLVTGKFGDSYDPAKDLTDAEYLAIKAQGGNVGAAINAATDKKLGITGVAGANAATTATDAAALSASTLAAATAAATAKAERTSAYNILFEEFNKYGLGTLVSDIKNLLVNSTFDPSEFSIQLQNTQAYQDRFSANKDRIAKGLAALRPADYIKMEDAYQNVMRNYGLPSSYYTKDATGRQVGFEKLLANDVSNTELEDRIMTAQQRVVNANPEVMASLKAFYPGITNGDILAYTLDPTNAITDIKRKVTAAEIGGAATQAGLSTGMTRAEELTAAGITKQQAQAGFQTVAEVAPRGGQLAAMYGESPYTQQTAEQEVFGLAGSVDAAKQRKKLVGLERAEFSGQSGTAKDALGRERAGNF